MRTVIETDQAFNVRLTYDDILSLEGGRIVRDFTCPMEGGYVRERIGYEWRQVCERLAGSGVTLMCKSRADLADLIRREYRRMRRDEKRELGYLANEATFRELWKARRDQ